MAYCSLNSGHSSPSQNIICIRCVTLLIAHCSFLSKSVNCSRYSLHAGHEDSSIRSDSPSKEFHLQTWRSNRQRSHFIFGRSQAQFPAQRLAFPEVSVVFLSPQQIQIQACTLATTACLSFDIKQSKQSENTRINYKTNPTDCPRD
jgi:hypothetical protein